MIIGIGGSKEVGKNTAAKVFRGLDFKELSFAAPLKNVCSIIFSLPYDLFDLPDMKDMEMTDPLVLTESRARRIAIHLQKYHKFTEEEVDRLAEVGKGKEFYTPRQALQFIGTDLIRACIDDQFWCNAMKIEASKYPNVVVTDVRFPNERKLMRDMGAKLVLVKRPGYGGSADGHVSEQSLGPDSDYDFIVHNNGHIIALQRSMLEWFELIKD